MVNGYTYDGELAAEGQYPWMALVEVRSVHTDKENFCGGALISKRHVLSAAHCFRGKDKTVVLYRPERIRLGVLYRSIPSNPRDTYQIKSLKIHHAFNRNSFPYKYDLAILETDRDVTFTQSIYPICLPEEGEDFIGDNAETAGERKNLYKSLPDAFSIYSTLLNLTLSNFCTNCCLQAGVVLMEPMLLMNFIEQMSIL